MYKLPEFHKKLTILLKKVLPLIEPAIKNDFWPKKFDNYPNISYKPNGFPQIKTYPSRVDISSYFRLGPNGKEPIINLKKINEFEWLMNAVITIPEFADYFRHPNNDLPPEKRFNLFVDIFIENFIERYFYIYGQDFSNSKFSKIYAPIENYFCKENLNLDIVVPILFLKFNIDTFKINDKMLIRRIKDEDQRARYNVKLYSPAILDSVYMSATHELVLKNYYITRQPSWWDFNYFNDPSIYPLETFEKIFTILNLVTNQTSGYSQILLYPKDWADRYESDIKYVNGTSTKNYPPYFDEYYWNSEEHPEININQLNEIKNLYNKTESISANKINIALKRFYKSIMRNQEEDIIIDLIIALEILLSDNEKGEITYKLSMRLTSLICRFSPNKYKAEEVMNMVKKIYDYRSAIVHGSPERAKKNREIKQPDNTIIPTIEFAKLFLREVLKIMISEPKYLDPKKIDFLILPK